MSTSTWNNVRFIPAPQDTTVKVKDSIDGVTYFARWNKNYGWTVVSYPDNAGVVGKPQFWFHSY